MTDGFPHPPSHPRHAAVAPRRVLIAINTFAAYQRQMIEGLIRYAGAHAPHWEFIFQKASQSPIALIQENQDYDSVLGCVTDARHPALARLRRRRVPAVLIEGYGGTKFPRVNGDNRAIGAMAFEHLRSKGFRHYAFVGWGGELFVARGESFAAAVRAAGLELVAAENFVDPNVIEHNPGWRKWVAEVPRPLGLFAANADMARHVLALCRHMGVVVPEEIAVIGVDNEPLECTLSRPPLSTIDHGMEQAGYEAAALLHRLMNGEPAPTEPIVVQPLGVIERQSTDTLAVNDPDVRAAITLIRQQATTGLTVKELLHSLPVTRRKLEIAFRTHLGRSIHDELTRIRLDRSKFLLRTTEMALPAVAAACGFQYSTRLTELFGKTFGVTPTAYRRGQRGA